MDMDRGTEIKWIWKWQVNGYEWQKVNGYGCGCGYSHIWSIAIYNDDANKYSFYVYFIEQIWNLDPKLLDAQPKNSYLSHPIHSHSLAFLVF